MCVVQNPSIRTLEPEVDAAAAEEERADEEEAREEDADPGVGAVGEVLVDRAGARVLPGVERDRVGDREHADPGEQDGERRIPAGADVGARDTAEDEGDGEHRPDRERLRDRVHRREVLLAERPVRRRSQRPGSCDHTLPCRSDALVHLRPGRQDDKTFEHRMSTIPDPLSAHSPSGPLRVRSVVGLAYDEIRSLIVTGRWRPVRGSARASSPSGSASPGDRCARRCGGSRVTGSSTSRSTVASSSPRSGSTTSATARGAARARARDRAARSRAAERRATSSRCTRRSPPRQSAQTSDEVHDASRAFHFAVAAATAEQAFTKLLDGALDRRHRPAAARPAPPGGGVAGRRRRGAPRDRRGARGRRRRARRSADARARRERLPALVAAERH